MEYLLIFINKLLFWMRFLQIALKKFLHIFTNSFYKYKSAQLILAKQILELKTQRLETLHSRKYRFENLDQDKY